MDANERIRKLEEQRQRIDARIAAIRARAQTQARKDDTRRKVLAGSVVLKAVREGTLGAQVLRDLLDRYLEADRDRRLFDLPPKNAQEGP